VTPAGSTRLRLLPGLLVLILALAVDTAVAADRLSVRWQPAKPRVGDVALMLLRGAPDDATVEGTVDGRPLTFFPYAGGRAALVGFDLEVKAGVKPWRLAVLMREGDPRTASGKVRVAPRTFPVQRLSLPSGMVDLDPETERRAVSEGERLRTLYRTITPERLWRGPFTRPVGGTGPGTGFGARRVINGKPRMPHGGADYAAPAGTPVVAVNTGRVALVADFFFPGRLVAIDHGLGLYTLYFHLESAVVSQGDLVERGQTIGTVGATGRATGPHLHFGAHIVGARIDPATLLELGVRD
jgi:murein DD-endopeptidase MepM/ murein hydrolase activator NlpD